MRNSNLDDERKLHERGEFEPNVMFQDFRGDKFHIKKLNRCACIYGDLYAAQQVLAETADTNVLTVFHRKNLFAINRGNTQPTQKKSRIKPHVKGTRPERLVPYDSKLMNKPRWVKLRDGRRDYAESNGCQICLCKEQSNVWLSNGNFFSFYESGTDIVGVYLPFEEWNTSENSTHSVDSDGWISGNDVPQDGNSYFVKRTSNAIYVATWAKYSEFWLIGSVVCADPFWKIEVTAYKPVEHEGLYKYGY